MKGMKKMKRISMTVAASTLLAVMGLTVAVSLGMGEEAVEAQTRTTRTVRGKRGAAAVPGQGTPTQATAPAACGERGQPKCPLEAWMEDEVEAAAEAADAARLAAAYEKMARFAPEPSWNEGPNAWRAIAEAAAAKARAGDLRGARAACKQCHQAWRERYRAEHRARPLPR